MYHAQQEKTPALMSSYVMLKMPIALYNNHLVKNSDHNMINMQPIYRRKLAKSKPQEKEIVCITDESMERLNASFDVTNWDVFVDNSKDVNELVDTISEYIKFNVDMLVPKKTVKQYANNKPWISSELRRQIVKQT